MLHTITVTTNIGTLHKISATTNTGMLHKITVTLLQLTQVDSIDSCRQAATRGVQYVHWVMHKCIMVKVGGKIHTKYVKSW